MDNILLLRRFPVGKARACSHSTLSFPLGVAQRHLLSIFRATYLSAIALRFIKITAPLGVSATLFRNLS